MNIMELGAIGELVGGVAVVASLLYVGLQVRQSNLDGRAESHRAFMAQWNRAVHDPLLHRETSSVLRQAGRDFVGLDGDEQPIAHGYWQALILLGQEAHALRQSGHLDPVLEGAVNRIVAGFLKMQGADQWWQRMEDQMPPEYTTYLRDQYGESVLPLDEIAPWFAVQGGTQGTEARP